MGEAMSDLETLIAQPVELVIDGEPLAIKPLKVGQMPAFLRAISPVMQQLTSSEIDWLALFGERGDDLLSAIAIAVGKPRTWVDELAADEAILLAAKVIEVNAEPAPVRHRNDRSIADLMQLQRLPQEPRDLLFIFDDQNMHGDITLTGPLPNPSPWGRGFKIGDVFERIS